MAYWFLPGLLAAAWTASWFLLLVRRDSTRG